uniref:Uncharacterized protein n=1 Tax=Arundo donax TaxID=35708 RepID=A0A0A9HJ92_ARUDO
MLPMSYLLALESTRGHLVKHCSLQQSFRSTVFIVYSCLPALSDISKV